jgi:carboxyl-terminal processing protease
MVKIFLGHYGMLFVLLGIFSIGVLIGRFDSQSQISSQDISSAQSSKVDLETFWQVWNYVKKNYVEQPVLEDDLFRGALFGTVAALGDPYSIYLDPETTKEFSKELAGEFEGIGAEIGIRDDVLTVIAALPGSPAQKVGLLAGDKILTIDGANTQQLSLDYCSIQDLLNR